MRCSSVTIFLLSMSSSPSLRYAQNSLASPSRKSLTKSQRGTRMYDSLISLMRPGITLPHSTWILSGGKSKDKKQKQNAERMHRSLTFNDTWNSRDGVIISAKSNQELKPKLNISRNGYWTTQAQVKSCTLLLGKYFMITVLLVIHTSFDHYHPILSYS